MLLSISRFEISKVENAISAKKTDLAKIIKSGLYFDFMHFLFISSLTLIVKMNNGWHKQDKSMAKCDGYSTGYIADSTT